MKDAAGTSDAPRGPGSPPQASLQRSILLTVLVTLLAVLVLMVL